MIGLVFLIAGAVYLVILVWVTRGAYRWATREGFSKGKCRLIAAGGFLVVYLPVFWDHIPTLITHQYFCATEAGFRIYKTLDQWKTENPGILETLVAAKHGRSMNGAYVLNERFNWAVRRSGPLPINRWKWEQEIIDSKTNQVLARYVDFSAGNGNIEGELPIKFWLQIGHCIGGERDQDALRRFRNNFRGAEK